MSKAVVQRQTARAEGKAIAAAAARSISKLTRERIAIQQARAQAAAEEAAAEQAAQRAQEEAERQREREGEAQRERKVADAPRLTLAGVLAMKPVTDFYGEGGPDFIPKA